MTDVPKAHDVQILTGPAGRQLAYVAHPGRGPWIVFLSGYASDMEGTKAVHLEAWARAQGRAFLRLDYSGHGRSSEAFTDGCIGDWAADAQAVITAVTDGAVVLVGSSMGGWISCLLSQRLPRVAGFVGIAAAPDFTEDGMWASFDDAQRKTLWDEGVLMLPSDYDAPYAVTRKIIEDGRNHLVLRAPLPMNFPVRLLQGSDDVDVLPQVAVALLNHIEGGDVRMVLVKGADHRFSSPDCLTLLERTVAEVAQIK